MKVLIDILAQHFGKLEIDRRLNVRFVGQKPCPTKIMPSDLHIGFPHVWKGRMGKDLLVKGV